MSDPAPISSPWKSRPDRARQRADKREAVLQTAVRHFNERGFANTSLDDVARALSVTKPTIYHYFSNKDEILFECLRLGLEGIREAADAAVATGGTGMERLVALVRAYALIKTRDFGICVSRTTDDQLAPESRDRFRAMKREIHEILQGVIADGVADGTIAAPDPRLAAFALAGSLNWITRWYVPGGEMSPEKIADGMVETLIRGLAPRP